jgi:hypothetical protein
MSDYVPLMNVLAIIMSSLAVGYSVTNLIKVVMWLWMG